MGLPLSDDGSPSGRPAEASLETAVPVAGARSAGPAPARFPIGDSPTITSRQLETDPPARERHVHVLFPGATDEIRRVLESVRVEPTVVKILRTGEGDET